MKYLQQFLAATVLALVFVAPVCAGDMSEPPAPPPPNIPANNGETHGPTIPTPGASATPLEPVVDITSLVFDVLFGVLSIH